MVVVPIDSFKDNIDDPSKIMGFNCNGCISAATELGMGGETGGLWAAHAQHTEMHIYPDLFGCIYWSSGWSCKSKLWTVVIGVLFPKGMKLFDANLNNVLEISIHTI